ncbi:general secretion pathway protein E [Actimicrobium sp. GrIS 1.19]|uniref:GspE/PulE family protein n=1 Tax=Actimicrobium sp. GrIS 1.19 TaxID=3071708 RepID=UPI002E02CB91|nr:general secretion pathway protein E [Actimicrobium sp. GrIS 1.19]
MNMRARQAGEDLLAPMAEPALTALDMLSLTVLSADGVFEASAEERKLLCLLSDGRLLIASGQELNPHVQSYRARLDRMKRSFTPVHCSIELIGRAYQGGGNEAGARHQTHTMMQVTAKDLMAKGCRDRASDIHIRVNRLSTEFYFRIHNDLVKVGGQTREYGERLLATIYGAMTTVSDNSYKPTERQDASIGDRDKLPDMLYGVRIATAPTSEGSLMVLRLLYNDAGDHIDLRPLGFADAHADCIQRLKDQPIGMNIISGPTGSGKSTTLQRVLAGELLESHGRLHVLTVEDPVEYPIPGAVQTAVTNANTEAERSRLFSAAISNAMRLDPDTIMIGEIRDGASAQSALRAAMTGHQIWSTVHANSAIAIIDRLVDLGLPLAMVADHTVLTGLISQRLAKLLCAGCKQPLREHPADLSAALMQRLQTALGARIKQVCLTGSGCKACGGHGTIGRTVLAEVIVPDARFCALMRAGDKIGALAWWHTELGGRSIVEHAIAKVGAGLIDPRVAEKTVGHLVSVPPTARPES